LVIYRLSATAERDIARLIDHTQERFGEVARRRYRALLATGMRDIAENPDRLVSVGRPELGFGVRSYHLRHSRNRALAADGIVRQPRCILLYCASFPDIIGIGRILHESMEIERHLPNQYGDE
jgi:toxin ParE1/3/4